MRYHPDNEYSDKSEAERMQAPEWMLAALKLNPSYVSWGPWEDYMARPGRNESEETNPYHKDNGWEARCLIERWADHGFGLDDLNECVNFYFSIDRHGEQCDVCAGRGRHPDAQWITESWYRHSSPFTTPDVDEAGSKAVLEQFGCRFTDSVVGRGTLPPDDVIARYGKPFLEHCVSTMENGGEWSTDITQDEVQALIDGHRLYDLTREFIPGEGWRDKGVVPTAAEVNLWARSRRGIGHDSINAWICQRQRCERLGVPYDCDNCEGHGDLIVGPPFLSLTLWMLHPRKGCSRGVEIKHIAQHELPEAVAYLAAAAKRNADRFMPITDLVESQSEVQERS